MEYMIWVWLGIFVVAVITEAITQELVSIWFAIGALVTLAISGFTELYVQVIVFVVVSVVALAATRPVVSRLMNSRNIRKTNTDDFIGKKLKAITNITKYDGGEVKLNGIIYTAILLEDVEKTIESDSIVEVVALKGNKLVVKKCEENIKEEKESIVCF